MPREANAIDFWRGFALISIFVNHIPGIWYERLTHRNLSISDSAELFVFLAGWSLGLLVGSKESQKNIPVLGFRLGGRAVQIYAAHILISGLALALLAAAVYFTENPLILEWHNASAFFQDPAHVQMGIVLLTHQLGYFDILPLYVVLMLAAPAFAVIDRLARPLLVPLSLALYFASLTVPFTATTWPVEGQWFFNPFTWQAIFVLGFALSRDEGLGAVVRRNIKWVRYAATPVVAVSAILVVFNWFPDPTKLPEPRLLFLNGKSFLTPMRLLQFLALAAVFSAAYPLIARLRWVPEFMSIIGRNSLYVFCVGSLLSLSGQIVRFLYSGSLAVDTIVVIVGIGLLWLTAWMSEWRERATLVCGMRAVLVAAVAVLAMVQGVCAQTPQPEPPAIAKECGEARVIDTPLPNGASAIQQRKKIKILAIGASSAAVLGMGRGGTPPLLERILERTIKGLDVEIINRGFSGELAEAAGERLKIEVALNHPDIVLWQVGTNDAFAQVPVETFELTVSNTVRWLKSHNIDVILVGLHYMKQLAKDEHYQAIRASLRRIASAENVLRIGRYEAMEVLARSAQASGQLEPQDFGLSETSYNCMAQYIARTITVGVFARPAKTNPSPPPAPPPSPEAPN